MLNGESLDKPPVAAKILQIESLVFFSNNVKKSIEDIANYVTLISQSNSSWMTGNVIRIDGGEDIVG